MEISFVLIGLSLGVVLYHFNVLYQEHKYRNYNFMLDSLVLKEITEDGKTIKYVNVGDLPLGQFRKILNDMKKINVYN
jgi:hypothetical protein